MKKGLLLFFFIVPIIIASAQDSVTMYMELPIGPHHTITFLKDVTETERTSLPDSFFNRPMYPNYKVDYAQYALVLKFPREYNFFVFRIDDNDCGSRKALIGCISTQKNSSFRLKSFDYIDSVENSMETYKKALELEFAGRKWKANKMYKQAAEGGNVLAMIRLAENYRNGVGCIRNTKKAYYWYKQASYFGDDYSESMIQGDSYKQKSVYSVMTF